MKKLFQEFEVPTISTWKSLLTKELKTDTSIDPTSVEFPIEELYVQDLYTAETRILSDNSRKLNDWLIGVEITITHAQEANKKALQLLNTGANSLHFILEKDIDLQLDILLNNIEVSYIHCKFTVKNSTQVTQITAWFAEKSPLQLEINLVENEVNAYDVFSIGANASQELAFALAKGKAILTNNAITSVSFTFGIGTNFLIEIAKFRAFHQLWDRITNAMQKSVLTTITAKTGFTNKSLQDPYTNILRQTTEALSAVTGGVDTLIVQPYDLLSVNGSSEFTERMALNISLILKEESEINQLVDPFAGSIILEKLTNSLCDSAWKNFQKMEKFGGYTSEAAIHYLKDDIQRIREKRMEEIATKKRTVVGINKYFNPDSSNLQWKHEIESYLGVKHFIAEQMLNKVDTE